MNGTAGGVVVGGMSSISVNHNGTEITYDEEANLWRFTLRGRDRSSENLTKAREVIDKPVPADKAKPFQKFSAWFFVGYSEALPEKVEVTGIAENRYSRQEVWIKNPKGTRSKENIEFRIYECSPENDAKIEQISGKLKERKALYDQIVESRKELKQIEVAPE